MLELVLTIGMLVGLMSLPFGGLSLAKKNLWRYLRILVQIPGHGIRLAGAGLERAGEWLQASTRFEKTGMAAEWLGKATELCGETIVKGINFLPRPRS